MLHAAMFEAVNSIDPQFHPYKASIDAPKGTSAAAAASSAAYRVLATVLPAQASTLEGRHKELTAGIPESADKAAGILVGEKAAAAILALRANDGADFSPAYTPVPGTGMYMPTSTGMMAFAFSGQDADLCIGEIQPVPSAAPAGHRQRPVPSRSRRSEGAR